MPNMIATRARVSLFRTTTASTLLLSLSLLLPSYHHGTGRSYHIVVETLDKLCRYEKQQWCMSKTKFSMQRVLTKRYPGVRGSVQYKRETGGLVGQLWQLKQRHNHHSWWW